MNQLIPHVCGQGLQAELVEPTQALCGCLFFLDFSPPPPPNLSLGAFFLMAKLIEKMWGDVG